jgi:FkbM family methyltransferase
MQAVLNYHSINKVFDVGANTGQFALYLRNSGYKEEIISFEPLSSAYDTLSKKAKKDGYWETYNCALGEKKMNTTINIAGNSTSSSLLEMMNSHIKSKPKSAFQGKENIEVKTLDDIFPQHYNKNDNVFLKIDTQGYERKVLEGAKNSLRSISVLQLEISLTPLYKNETLFFQMNKYLENLGFELFSIEPGYYDKTNGRLLQFDAIYTLTRIK